MKNVMRKTVGHLLPSKTKDLGHGVVEVVVSTGRKDRHGEMLDIKGLNTKDYSGVVLLNHDYSALPIGKSISLRKTTDGKLISKTQFAVNEYPVANTVYKLVAGGYMPDVSIGFIPKEWDESTGTWTKSEMVEYSHVGIGANPDAKVTGKAWQEIGVAKSEFDEQVRDHLLHAKDLKAKGAVADELNQQDKWEYMAAFWEVVYAFADAYYSEDIKAADFNTLLTECIDILKTIVDGSYGDEPGDGDPGVVVVGQSLKKGVDNARRKEIMAIMLKEAVNPVDPDVALEDNVRNHLNAMKSLISATEQELDSLDQGSEADDSQQTITKKITLVRAKKTLNSVDRITELAIGELKKSIKG